MNLTYRDAGLDLDVYEQTIQGMIPLLRRTHTPRVLDGFGGFASLFSLDYNCRLFAKNYRHPVLIACTDGVGSKLKIAGLMNKHDTVGIDLVAMSVNDALCTGGEPLIFLDYLAMPKDDPALTRDLVKGISDGCMEADCALVGGETAILPDFYQPGDYDMAGFCVGVVERDHIISGKSIQVGDVVLGLASSGLHSNGYSLVRKVVFEHAGLNVADYVPELGRTVGEELLEPTRIYVKPLLALARAGLVKSAGHITGGGWQENVPRALTEGLGAEIDTNAWEPQPIFDLVARAAGLHGAEPFDVFNMGIGMVVVVEDGHEDDALALVGEAGEYPVVVGRVTPAEGIRMV